MTDSSRNPGVTRFEVHLKRGNKTEKKTLTHSNNDVTAWEFEWTGAVDRPKRGQHRIDFSFGRLPSHIHYGFVVLSAFGLGGARDLSKFVNPSVSLHEKVADGPDKSLCETFKVVRANLPACHMALILALTCCPCASCCDALCAFLAPSCGGIADPCAPACLPTCLRYRRTQGITRRS
jgi:hypothetical protein